MRNILQCKSLLKRITAIGLCVASATSMIIAAIPTAEAAASKASKDTLGTNTALGSPVLNQTNFTTEDWNEWETICWGVFLSNFCNPFIDNYKSAFKAGYGGSDGHGYDALWGGTGSDSANAAVIKALTEYAIDVQAGINEEIYVGYTKIVDGQPEVKKDELSVKESDLRPATIRDLFFYPASSYADSDGGSDNITYAVLRNDDNSTYTILNTLAIGGQYDSIAMVNEGNLPTFYVHRPVGENKFDENYTHAEYIEILDYTDWWDVQIMSWLTNAVRQDTDLDGSVIDNGVEKVVAEAEEVVEDADGISGNSSLDALQKLWDSNAAITFDTFGNIVVSYDGTDGCMVLPACTNQHITGKATINIVNSWMLNNVVSNVSEDTFLLGMRQNFENSYLGCENISSSNGLPAFGTSSIGNVGLFYYDLDSVYVQEYKKLNGKLEGLIDRPDDYNKLLKDAVDAEGESSGFKYGNALLKLFDTKIDSKLTNPNLPLKFEIAKNDALKTLPTTGITGEYDLKSILTSQYFCASALPNVLFDDSLGEAGQKTMLTKILTPKGEVKNLFGSNPIAIPVRVKDTTQGIQKSGQSGLDNERGAGVVRYFYNWMYSKYNIAANGVAKVDKQSVTNALRDRTFQDMCEWWGNPDDTGTMFYSFTRDYKDKGYAFASSSNDGLWGFMKSYKPFNAGTGTQFGMVSDADMDETFNINTNRVVLAYQPNETMKGISDVLGIKDGSEFDLYCSYIYMTYLDFYGINETATLKTGVHNSSEFDSLLYNTDLRKSILITDVAKSLYEYDTNFADKINIEDEVLQMSYMMLEPNNQSARDYRRQLTNNAITDFMYEQYNRIVFGGSSNYSGTTSRSKSGFLSIETYADNFLTGWFLDAYVTIVVFLIMGAILAIIVIGLIKQRKISWFFISIIVAVNSLMLAPTSGEIVPYVTSNIVTRMFSNKMTFWSISQGITNNSVEKSIQDRSNEFSELSDQDATIVASLINDLSTLQTDSSLCVKQDISQKVTQSVNGIYKDVESYPSARWIIPMVMQQFSSDKEQSLENFIYKPVNNIWIDLSNIYWYFDPEDAKYIDSSCKTYTSGQITTNMKQRRQYMQGGADFSGKVVDLFADEDYEKTNEIFECLNTSKVNTVESDPVITQIYPDFIMPDNMQGNIQDNSGKYWFYRCYSHTLHDPNKEVHVVLPYLTYGNRILISRKSIFGANADSYKDANSWGEYIAQSNAQLRPDAWYVSWDTSKGPKDPISTLRMEDTADSYDRYDRDTITDDMPYLLSTESPIYYFYAVVKDSFESSYTLGKVVNEIQGTVDRDSAGNNVIAGFMYTSKSDFPTAEHDVKTGTTHYDTDVLEDTGYVRDVLDLQELFTNVVPYMYQMSITACGFNGTDGLLGDSTISDELTYYEGELQSWMYRCNWATKLMENPSFSEPTTVKDASGTSYVVNNPMLAESYPSNRPMVFSEGQREAMGLKDSDLSLVELKCIKLNKDVANSWTMLLNYATTQGITKEIIYRQMATDSTLLFSSEFSSSGILDTKYTMYPTSLDLRFLSYDAVMKIMMLNVSRNTNFIYGDSMLTVLTDVDMITAVFLLLSAFLGAYIMPFIRSLLMAIVFFLGFWALIKTILADGKKKFNITCGQVITNVLFMLYTIIYYAAFWLLMGRNSATEVLTTRTVKDVASGSPFWLILLTCIINVVYIVVLCAHIKFCIENRADMGFSAYSQMASSIVGSINGLGGRVGNSLSNFFGGEGFSNSTGNTQSIKGSGIGAGSGSGLFGFGGASGQTGETDVTVVKDNKQNSLGLNDADYAAETSYEAEPPIESDTTASDINNMIDDGAKAIAKDTVVSFDQTS